MLHKELVFTQERVAKAILTCIRGNCDLCEYSDLPQCDTALDHISALMLATNAEEIKITIHDERRMSPWNTPERTSSSR